MKKGFFNCLILLLLAPAATSFGQGEIFVSKSVLKTAEWAEFPYKDMIKKFKAGDGAAITEFFKFNSVVDGVEGIEHNVTCLELIPFATDYRVANSLNYTNPKLKKLVLSRLVLAQGKTQKAELQKPLESWAPCVWAVLNNKPLVAPKADEKERDGKLMQIDATDGMPAEGAKLPPTLKNSRDGRQ